MGTTTAPEARTPAGVARSLVEQARLIAASGRWNWIALTLVLAVALVGGGRIAASAPAVLVASIILLPVGAVWAVRVWAGEEPERRSYQWSLPVRRGAHELARVVVGAGYLVLAYAVMAVAGAIVAARTGGSEALAAVPASAWANFFVAPLIIYFMVMPMVLWDFAVMRWVVGGFVAFAMLGFLVEPLARAMHALLFAEGLGLSPALLDGTLGAFMSHADRAPWWPASVLWLGGGIAVTVFTAWFRPDDVRRLLR